MTTFKSTYFVLICSLSTTGFCSDDEDGVKKIVNFILHITYFVSFKMNFGFTVSKVFILL